MQTSFDFNKIILINQAHIILITHIKHIPLHHLSKKENLFHFNNSSKQEKKNLNKKIFHFITSFKISFSVLKRKT